MSDFALSQAIASIAFACGVVSFQMKTRRSILLWLCGTGFTNACHYFILGRAAPGVLCIVIGARCVAAAFSVSQKVMLVFIGLAIVGFSCLNKNPVGFLGLFATVSATYGSFQKAEPRVRVFHMLANVSWMVHDLLVWTPVAAAMQGTFLTSNLLGYWRHYGRGTASPGGDPGLTEEEV